MADAEEGPPRLAHHGGWGAVGQPHGGGAHEVAGSHWLPLRQSHYGVHV